MTLCEQTQQMMIYDVMCGQMKSIKQQNYQNNHVSVGVKINIENKQIIIHVHTTSAFKVNIDGKRE
jgi:hypothetical protein